MNPATTRFRAIEAPGNSCGKCIFAKCSYSECVRAADLAVQRGLPDCDDPAPRVKGGKARTYIYVLDETDPRQMDLLTVEREAA